MKTTPAQAQTETPTKPCTHLEASCKATRHAWNSNVWCPDCRTWFWHGDAAKDPTKRTEECEGGWKGNATRSDGKIVRVFIPRD